MKESRIGESLWSIWEGQGYNPAFPDSVIYHTETHIDVQHEVVKRALASLIQREGIVYSLSQGFQAIDSGVISQGWMGSLSDELYQEICDENGITIDGVELEEVTAVTFVEVPDFV